MADDSDSLEALVRELAIQAVSIPVEAIDMPAEAPSETIAPLSKVNGSAIKTRATEDTIKAKPSPKPAEEPDYDYLLPPDMARLVRILKGKEPGTRLRIVRRLQLWDEMGMPDSDEYMPLALKGCSLPDLTQLFFENKCTADSSDLGRGIQNAIRYQEFKELDGSKDHNDLYANAIAEPWHSRHSLNDPFRFRTMLYTELQSACDIDDKGEVTILDSPEIVGDDVLELGQAITSRRLWKNRRADFEESLSKISEERKLTLSCEEQEYLGLASQFIGKNKLYSERDDLQQIKSKIDDVLQFYVQEPVELSLTDLEVDIFHEFIDDETDVIIPDEDVVLLDEFEPEPAPAQPEYTAPVVRESGAPLPPPSNAKRVGQQVKAQDDIDDGSVSLEGMFKEDKGIHKAYDGIERSAAEQALYLEKRSVAATVAKARGLEPEPVQHTFSTDALNIRDEEIPFFREHIREEKEEARRRDDSDFASAVMDTSITEKEEVIQESHPETYRILMSTPNRERVSKTEDSHRDVTTGAFDLGAFSRVSAETDRAFESHVDDELDGMLRYLEAESDIERVIGSLQIPAPNLRFATARAGFIIGSYDRSKIARMNQIEKKYTEVIFHIDKKRKDAAKKLEGAKGAEAKNYEKLVDSASDLIGIVNEAKATILDRFSSLMEEFPPDSPAVAAELSHNLRSDLYQVLVRLKQSHSDKDLKEDIYHLETHVPDDRIYVRYLIGELDSTRVRDMARASYDELSKRTVWGRVVGGISSLPSKLLKKEDKKDSEDPSQGPGTSDRSASDGSAHPSYIPSLMPDPSTR